jgi:YD repeat-containing protein
MKKSFFALAISLSSVGIVCLAQTNPNLENGVKPFGSYDATSIDTINLATGALSLHIPLLSYPQRGNFPPLKYSISFASKNLTINPHCVMVDPGPFQEPSCTPYWQAALLDGSGTPPLGVSVLADNGAPGVYWKLLTHVQGAGDVYQLYAAGSDHSLHPLISSPFISGTFISEDGTGFLCSGCNGNNILTTNTYYSRSGIYDNTSWQSIGSSNGYPGFGLVASPLEDSNGNLENTLDTMGRSYPTPATADTTGCVGTLPTMSAQILTVPGYNGGTTKIKICSATLTLNTNFNDSTYCDPYGQCGAWDYGIDYPYSNNTVHETGESQQVVETVLLYDGNSWTTSPAWIFQYDNDGRNGIGNNGNPIVYGDLVQITLPTGGTIQYVWNTVGLCGGGYPGNVDMSRGVVSRIATSGDGNPPMVTTYSPGGGVTNDGVNDTVHVFTGLGGSCSYYETQTQYYSGTQSSGTLLKTVNTEYNNNAFDYYKAPNGTNSFNLDPLSVFMSDGLTHIIGALPTAVTTTLPNGLVSRVESDYLATTVQGSTGLGPIELSTGNVIQKREYDWGNGVPGNLIRCTTNTYQSQVNSAYMNANLLDLPASVSVYSGACTGTPVSQTTYGYDETTLQGSGLTISQQLDTTVANPGVRGNRTSTRTWLNTTGNTINTAITYYDTGMPYQSVDAAGSTTTYSYSPTYNGAYLTQTQLPNTGTVNHIVRAGYDFNTGLMTSFTDQNNQVSNYYYDPLWRMTTATFPDRGYAAFAYPSFTTVMETMGITSSLVKTVETEFDGLGRLSQTKLLTDPDPQSTVYVTTTYNAQGQKYQVSNPFRSTSDPTYGVTTYAPYDGLGRLRSQIDSDGVSTQSWIYNGNSTTHTDEGGNQWQQTTDALGRLTKVLEPNGTAQAPSMETDYTYNALNNLTCVEQHGGVSGTGCSSAPSNDATSAWRVRRFFYDSLSRLLTAGNPETGTVGYTYSVPGSICAGDVTLPCSKTDARGVTTNYSYDHLNRLLSKIYTNAPAGSMSSCFTYDTAGGGIGRLAAEWTQAGSCPGTAPTSGFLTMRKFQSYDAMGRIISELQCVPSTQGPGSCTTSNPNPFSLTYGYDLAGNLTQYTNGTGSILFQSQYNGAGRLSKLTSSWSDSLHPPTLFTADPTNGYTAAGGIQNMILGDSIFVTKTYDSRLRTTGETATHP